MQKYSETKIRVRYGETDQMGVVYYGNYALYLEQARTELLRNAGFSYKELEKQNIFLPVVNLNIRYLKPARYDDLLTLKTCLKEKPSRKITFVTQMFNEQNQKINTSEVKLVFVNKKQQLLTCPEDINMALSTYLNI